MVLAIHSIGNARRIAQSGSRCWVAALAFVPVGAVAQSQSYTPTNSDGQIELILKDHRFVPSEIRVPAGKRIQLLVKNLDDKAEEFDSTALKVEKVIAGGGEGIVRLRELDPGRYPFMGEFHSQTAQGVVIAE